MTLFRTGDILMVALMLCIGFATYNVKYAALRRHQDVRALERKIEVERDSANVLRARLALAAEPERIARLARQYQGELQLEDISPRQIVRASDIPPRLPDAVEIAIRENSATPALDTVVTAGISPSGGNNAGSKAPPPPQKQPQKQIVPPLMGGKAPARKTRAPQPPYIMPKAGQSAAKPEGGKAR